MGVCLASQLGKHLRDDRVSFKGYKAVQIVCEPAMVFAVVDRATFLENLEDFAAHLFDDERFNLGGYRVELLCKGNSPSTCLADYEALIDPDYWTSCGAVVAKTVNVGVYLDWVQRALAVFKLLRVSKGDRNLQLSQVKQHICTDLLNFFGLCRSEMAAYLNHMGFIREPFGTWEYLVRNEQAIARQRLGRVRVQARRDANTQPVAGNYSRLHEGRFTQEDDEIIRNRGNYSRSGTKWQDLKSREAEE